MQIKFSKGRRGGPTPHRPLPHTTHSIFNILSQISIKTLWSPLLYAQYAQTKDHLTQIPYIQLSSNY